jgi:Leucine-rich repeat (LRR) protein
MVTILLVSVTIVIFFFETINAQACRNDQHRKVRQGLIYNIEDCTNTEINLGNCKERASLTHIQALNNEVSKISDDNFKWATELVLIDLRDNKIEQILVGAFKDQDKLTELYLKQNKLTWIEVGTFESLTELRVLWLQNNQLSIIEKGLFDKNKNLIHLYIDENKIIAIESTVFNKLAAIKFLHMNGNICVDKNFKNNEIGPDFECFTNFENLQPYFRKSVINRQPIIERDIVESGGSTKIILITVIIGFAVLLIVHLLVFIKNCQWMEEIKSSNNTLIRICDTHVYERVE